MSTPQARLPNETAREYQARMIASGTPVVAPPPPARFQPVAAPVATSYFLQGQGQNQRVRIDIPPVLQAMAAVAAAAAKPVLPRRLPNETERECVQRLRAEAANKPAPSPAVVSPGRPTHRPVPRSAPPPPAAAAPAAAPHVAAPAPTASPAAEPAHELAQDVAPHA